MEPSPAYQAAPSRRPGCGARLRRVEGSALRHPGQAGEARHHREGRAVRLPGVTPEPGGGGTLDSAAVVPDPEAEAFAVAAYLADLHAHPYHPTDRRRP